MLRAESSPPPLFAISGNHKDPHLKPGLWPQPSGCPRGHPAWLSLCPVLPKGCKGSSKWERLGLDLCRSTLNFSNLLLESSR